MTVIRVLDCEGIGCAMLAAWLGISCSPIQVGISSGPDASGGQKSLLASGGGSSVETSLGGDGGILTGGAAGLSTTDSRGGVSSISAGGVTTTDPIANGGAALGGASAGTLTTGGATSGSTTTNTNGTGGAASGGTTGSIVSGGTAAGGSYAGVAGTASAGTAGLAGAAGTAGAAGAGPACTDGRLEVRGHVRSPRGVPIPGVQLTLTGQTNETATTDAQGKYVFSHVCPGSVALTPSRAGLRFCSERAAFTRLTRSVDEDFTGSADGCLSPEIHQRLGIVIFDPLVDDASGVRKRLSKVMDWMEPMDLAEQYRRAIETVTNGRVRFEVVKTQIIDTFPQKEDGFLYTETTYRQCVGSPQTSCHLPDSVDYRAIAQNQALCEDSNNGAIDEVWLLGGPYFGFSLLQRIGPEPSSTDRAVSWLGTACKRVTNVFGFNYERELDVMLGGLRAESEAVLDKLYTAWAPQGSGTAYERFEFVAPLTGSQPMSGCGGHGRAPNASPSNPYDNSSFVDSYCDDFYDYPTLSGLTPSVRPTNCEAWDCSGLGYDRYWLRHLPSAKGTADDGMLANWWRYLLRPDDALATSHVTCSSSYETGWCEKVTDGEHGVCNSGEWATAHRATGWVEFSWTTPKAVSSVTLYDRACSEHVIGGHLEFSDGSADISFGALEDSGSPPSIVSFSTKRLRWLRVVIDESVDGGNPGFGEVAIE